MNQGPLRQPQRTVHLHAGPHKTASTYLQARLQSNRRELERCGLRYPTPWGEYSHRHLARAVKAGRLEALDQLLGRQQRWAGDLLLSAEHFAPLVADAAVLAELQRRCLRSGYGLHVISFVRPQGELLNSFYAHVLGRLYGTPGFGAYVRAQLAGRRLRGSARRRWIHIAPLALDLEQRFGSLLAADGLRSSFLPYGPGRCDPFEQLLRSLELPRGSWRPAPPGQANEQLGRRGLGLAYLLNAELDALPIRRNRLIADHGLNRLVERIRQLARRRGWVDERFNGWHGRLPALLLEQLGASNERFATRVWGTGWNSLFPQGAGSGIHGLVVDRELQDEAKRLFCSYRRGLPKLLR